MKKLSFLLLVAASLGACKKNDDVAPSRIEMLTAKNWRVSAETVTVAYNNKTTTTDAYAAMKACERDDFTKFNVNKTYTDDQGPSKCDPSDPQTNSGNWDFNGDQTKLTIADPAHPSNLTSFDIVTLSATTLHLRLSQTNNSTTPPTTYTADVTFTAF